MYRVALSGVSVHGCAVVVSGAVVSGTVSEVVVSGAVSVVVVSGAVVSSGVVLGASVVVAAVLGGSCGGFGFGLSSCS